MSEMSQQFSLTEPRISIIVPWHDCDPDRAKSWDWLKSWYSIHMPNAELIESTPGEGEQFNKPTLVNRAVLQAQGEIIIIADADVLPYEPDVLHKAVSHAQVAPWVVPHGLVLRLRPEPTECALRNDPKAQYPIMPTGPLIRYAYRGIAGGGLVVMRRERFLAMGGFDTAFKGWGGEDSAFGIVADCLLGPHLRYEHVPLLHFYHDPGKRSLDPLYADNIARVADYHALSSDREAMAKFRCVPLPPVEKLAMKRPSRDDDIFEWLLYLRYLGINVGHFMHGQKRAIMAHALNNEGNLPV